MTLNVPNVSQTKLVPKNISKQVTVSKRSVTTISRQGPVTRSQTSKIQRTVVKMDQEDLEDSFSTVANVHATNTATEPQAKSAVAKHYKNTGHVTKNSDFVLLYFVVRIEKDSSCFHHLYSYSVYVFENDRLKVEISTNKGMKFKTTANIIIF